MEQLKVGLVDAGGEQTLEVLLEADDDLVGVPGHPVPESGEEPLGTRSSRRAFGHEEQSQQEQQSGHWSEYNVSIAESTSRATELGRLRLRIRATGSLASYSHAWFTISAWGPSVRLPSRHGLCGREDDGLMNSTRS